MNFSLLDFKEKCREEELSLLILSSSDGLVSVSYTHLTLPTILRV